MVRTHPASNNGCADRHTRGVPGVNRHCEALALSAELFDETNVGILLRRAVGEALAERAA
jgi:hypothetical protein